MFDGTHTSGADQTTGMKSIVAAAITFLALPCALEAFRLSALPAQRGQICTRRTPFTRSTCVVRMADVDEEEQVAPPSPLSSTDAGDADRKLTFDINQRSRKGRTIDEDGKSNIWAYEPKQEVEVGKGSGTVVLGVVLALFFAALAALPYIQFPTYD